MAPTNASSRIPTNGPTEEPTYDPSHHPTQNPSDLPTIAPTMTPTIAPTTAPTNPGDILSIGDIESTERASKFCMNLSVNITDFDVFSTDELNGDSVLQEEMANITHYAVSQSAVDDGIAGDHFNVIYVDSAVDHEYINGKVQRSLLMTQSLCAISADDKSALILIIQHENDFIEDLIADRMTMLYLDGISSESMVVTISLLSGFTELSGHVTCCKVRDF